MIDRRARLELKVLPLSSLRVFEFQRRYDNQLLQCLELLDNPGNAGKYLGIISVKRRKWGYEILDGHHKYCAYVMRGQSEALCLIISD